MNLCWSQVPLINLYLNPSYFLLLLWDKNYTNRFLYIVYYKKAIILTTVIAGS